MKITFEFFGALERLAGANALPLEIEAGSTVEVALEQLAQRMPNLAEVLERCACAVGDELVLRNAELNADTKLALLPPVAGG